MNDKRRAPSCLTQYNSVDCPKTEYVKWDKHTTYTCRKLISDLSAMMFGVMKGPFSPGVL